MWRIQLVLLLLATLGSSSLNLIKEVVHETRSSTLAIRPELCAPELFQQLLKEPPVPVVLQSLETGKHFSRVLHLICIQSVNFSEEHLTSLQRKRSIFYVASGVSKTTSLHVLQLLLKQCYSLKILHVVGMITEEDGHFYYTYNPYPEFKINRYSAKKRPFYAKHFPNMHLQPLMVLPDQKHPRTIIYTDWRTGNQILAGSVGRFMKTLAWKLNATLTYPAEVKEGHTLHPRELIRMVEELHVDVPAGLILVDKLEQLPFISYPFELSHICLMIPIVQPIPIKDIYLILCDIHHILIALAIVLSFGWLLSLHRNLTGEFTSLVDFLLNDVALRGLLGQSFGQRLQMSLYSNWLYLLLGFLGLNLSCIHEAALGTLLTHPPKHFQPRTFSDVKRVNLPLIVDVADFKDFNNIDSLPLTLMPVNLSELNHLRDNMNMSHVYFASRLKWTLLSAQQKYFPRDVFLYSMDACVSALTLNAFQLPNNSWFEEPISQLIMDTRASGLFQKFVEMHFYDMSAADLIDFRDPIDRTPLRIGGPLRVDDLHWIGVAYGTLVMIALVVFILEVSIKRIQKRTLCLH